MCVDESNAEGTDTARADEAAERCVSLDNFVVYGDVPGSAYGELRHSCPVTEDAPDAEQRFQLGVRGTRERLGEDTVEHLLRNCVVLCAHLRDS